MIMVTYYRRYMGLSTEAKPTENVPPGSRYLETNTMDVYIYSGAEWLLLTMDLF